MSIQKLKKGFTLIELMVVIVIIGILAAIAIPKLFGMTAKAKASEVGPASGTWSKLQQAFSLEVPKAGNFVAIGYTPPGTLSDNGLTGTTTNFVYKDPEPSIYTDDDGTTGPTAQWEATPVGKLNACSEDTDGGNKWEATFTAADKKITSVKISEKELLTPATDDAPETVKVASGDCGSLTPNFGYLK